MRHPQLGWGCFWVGSVGLGLGPGAGGDARVCTSEWMKSVLFFSKVHVFRPY